MVTDARARALLERAPVGVVIVDENGTIELANAAACRQFRRDDLVHQSVATLVEMTTFAAARSAALCGTATTLELRSPTCITRARVEACTDGSGVVLWIDEAARTEEMRAIIEASPDLHFWTDETGRILEYHAPRPDLLAFPPEQFLGKRWSELFPDALAQKLLGALRDALRTGAPVSFEYSLDVANGPGFFDARYVPLRPDRAIAIIRDMTYRALAEQAARRVDEQYRLVTDGVPVLISYVDRDETYCLVNRAYEKTFGMRPEAIVGRTLAELLPPATYEAVKPYVRRVLAGEPVEFEATLDLPIGRRMTSVSYVPHRETPGEVQGFFALIVDVTEQRLLEQQLRHSQKMEVIGRLAGGIAHDFNNLLMVITTSTMLARRSLAAGRDPTIELDNIETASSRAATLTRQLLAFSRHDAAAPQVLDFDAVVQSTQTMLARMIGEDVALDVTLQSRGATVRADPGHFEQILMNLAVNARDAMPRGGVLSLTTARTTLAETTYDLPAGEYVRLTVADTGVGMDAATRGRIFEPFFTTKGHDKGTGLGLATVYGIVAQCNGAIAVYSEVGRGTRFEIYVPVFDGIVTRRSKSTPPPIARGGRVLLVEDEQQVRAALRRALEDENYVVIEAENGVDALALVEKDPFDIVVTDMIMPQSTGRELVQRIRERHARLPALFMSGYPEQHLAGMRLDDQALDAYLAKPFRVEDLLIIMNRLLDRAARVKSRS